MPHTNRADVIAWANIKAALAPGLAALDLERVITRAGRYGHGITAVALGEWYLRRRRALRALRRRLYTTHGLRLTAHKAPGGCPVLLNRAQLEHVRTRPVLLAGAGRVDKSPGRRRLLGPNIATAVIARDADTGARYALIGYHLTAEVEHDGRDRNRDGYRDDRPLRVRRHRLERRRLERWVRRQLRKGRRVYALGDSNLDLMPIPGLTSAWVGRERKPGTLRGGRRKIDDVHGPGLAEVAARVTLASDHDGLIAVRTR